MYGESVAVHAEYLRRLRAAYAEQLGPLVSDVRALPPTGLRLTLVSASDPGETAAMLFGALDQAYLFDVFEGRQRFERCLKKAENGEVQELTSLNPEKGQNVVVGLRWAQGPSNLLALIIGHFESSHFILVSALPGGHARAVFEEHLARARGSFARLPRTVPTAFLAVAPVDRARILFDVCLARELPAAGDPAALLAWMRSPEAATWKEL